MKKKVSSWKAHRGSIRDICFSPDGKSFCSSSSDGTVLIWDRFLPVLPKNSVQLLKVPFEAERLWIQLKSDNPGLAQQAMWILERHKKETTSFLRDRLRVQPRPNEATYHRLVSELEAPSLLVRSEAREKLLEMGESVEPYLRIQLTKKNSVEFQKALSNILEVVEERRRNPTSERRQILHSIAILEQIGDETAKQILKRLSEGDPKSQITMESEAALTRLLSR